jgi:amino-acid N-acetyltransferase
LPEIHNEQPFVSGFRHSAPYIHAHRGRTFVLVFGGEAVADPNFAGIVHDIALLHSLGIHLVLVHGARPQIEARLQTRGAELRYVNGLRVTDDAALACVKEAVGTVRVEIEALLSMGLINTPMSGARIGVSSGNFVTARPLGVRDGVDYCHTGEVRRIDGHAIRQHLQDNRIVLLSPIGYSPTGEVFNLSAEEVGTAAAADLQAEKLVVLVDGAGVLNAKRRLIRQLSLVEADRLMLSRRRLPEEMVRHLRSAIQACRHGVRRVHLINRHTDGALLLELFTRDGLGTLITAETYEGLRPARIDDVGGIIELIAPLEAEGIFVRRSRELLEMEIGHFIVVERDGMIISCAALYPSENESIAELACLAVHPDYRNQGRGDALLEAIEQRAVQTGIRQLVVLTTRTAHWFRERGFQPATVSHLPVRRRDLYNYQRQSKIFVKPIGAATRKPK